MSPLDDANFAFVAGLLTTGHLVAALFFWRFWRRSMDPLFVAFSAAFVLMAVNQALPALFDVPEENLAAIYLLRLLAFGLIIAAILRKNLRR